MSYRLGSGRAFRYEPSLDPPDVMECRWCDREECICCPSCTDNVLNDDGLCPACDAEEITELELELLEEE